MDKEIEQKIREFQIKWKLEPINNLNYKDRIRFKNDKWDFWVRFEDIDEIIEIHNDIKKIIENYFN